MRLNPIDALKHHYKIDHNPRIQMGKGRQRRAEFACTCTCGHSQEVYLEQRPGMRQ